MAKLDKIVEGLYRVSIETQSPMGPFSFNLYVIKDEMPALIHTGSSPMFDEMMDKASQVIKLSELKYVFISHFEADEAGALTKLLAANKDIVPLVSAGSARQLSGFGLHPKPQVVKPDEELSLGRRKLRFIAYPSEAHLWEGLLAYESVDRVLFSSDLFIARGKEEAPVKKADPKEALKIAPVAIAAEEARQKCQEAVDKLSIAYVAPGHGPVLDVRG